MWDHHGTTFLQRGADVLLVIGCIIFSLHICRKPQLSINIPLTADVVSDETVCFSPSVRDSFAYKILPYSFVRAATKS
jgi:hypothetical protein